MKRLSEKKIQEHIADIRLAAKNPKAWKSQYSAFCIPVRLEIPGGELARDDSGAWLGFLAGHKMMGRITLGLRITGEERFWAQGLEGKAAIESTLVSVVSIWDELPKHRRALYA